MNGVSRIFFVLAVFLYGQLEGEVSYVIYNNTDVSIEVRMVSPNNLLFHGQVPETLELKRIDPEKYNQLSLANFYCPIQMSFYSMDNSYWTGFKSLPCESQNYAVRIKKDKNGNPETRTIGKETRKLFDIVEVK